MSKIMALDLGDQWVGVALSDVLGIFAKPYTTVPTAELEPFIQKITKEERIKDVVIGYPRTMRGGESNQTRKVVASKEKLALLFPEVSFILWDERLSSKWAEAISSSKTKEEKLRSHARAAAFILDNYLSYLQNQKVENISDY